MIALLEGTVVEKTEDIVIISCNGVGYGLWVTAEDYGRLNQQEPAKLYIYEHIREQSHDLFGFIDKATKQLFELLLTVNGVGPKMAINILSVAKTDDVRSSIAAGDTALLKTASGVGKRVAERVVVDLKDKVGLQVSDNWEGFISPSGSTDEAYNALISLGFSSIDAQNSLKSIDKQLPVEQRIKLALKNGASK